MNTQNIGLVYKEGDTLKYFFSFINEHYAKVVTNTEVMTLNAQSPLLIAALKGKSQEKDNELYPFLDESNKEGEESTEKGLMFVSRASIVKDKIHIVLSTTPLHNISAASVSVVLIKGDLNHADGGRLETGGCKY